MPGVFITATGTDIGKTFVSAGLIRHWRAQGHAVQALKPVLSGYDVASAASSDAGVLLQTLGLPATEDEVARIAPWRFAAPLAPDMAAAREGRRIDANEIVAFCRDRIAAHEGLTLIEGVGGVMVPLDETRTVLDWMTALRLPVVLVAGSYLGTISHTLTAVDVLRRSGVTIAAIAVSESETQPVPLDETVSAIKRFVGTIEVAGVPRTAGPQYHEVFGRIAALIN